MNQRNEAGVGGGGGRGVRESGEKTEERMGDLDR